MLKKGPLALFPFVMIYFMSRKTPKPSITRSDCLFLEGLERLDKQLSSGQKVNTQVLQQWIKRYGESARVIINKYESKDADS